MIVLTGNTNLKTLFPNGYPIIKHVIYEEYDAGFIYEPHIHECAEIVLAVSLQGECTDWVDGRPYPLRSGSITILNAGQLHETVTAPGNPTQGYSVVLDNVHLQGLKPGQIISEDVCPVITYKPLFDDIHRIFKELYRDYYEKSPFYYEISQANLIKLICYIHRIISEQPKPHPHTSLSLTRRVQLYIDQHIQEELNLERLGELFFVSPYHISHEMKKELNTSPISYLISRRIGEAKRLLQHTDYPIQQISKMVGYKNPYYFNKLFEKKTGYTPEAFRARRLRSLKP